MAASAGDAPHKFDALDRIASPCARERPDVMCRRQCEKDDSIHQESMLLIMRSVDLYLNVKSPTSASHHFCVKHLEVMPQETIAIYMCSKQRRTHLEHPPYCDCGECGLENEEEVNWFKLPSGRKVYAEKFNHEHSLVAQCDNDHITATTDDDEDLKENDRAKVTGLVSDAGKSLNGKTVLVGKQEQSGRWRVFAGDNVATVRPHQLESQVQA